MALLDQVKSRIQKALLEKNEVEKSILRLVVGEAQTLAARQGSVNDEQVQKIVRKLIESNREVLSYSVGPDTCNKLQRENEILESLLPKLWSKYQLEEFLLDGNSPEFHTIKSAKSHGQAMGIAMRALKAANAPVDAKDVGAIIEKIRAS